MPKQIEHLNAKKTAEKQAAGIKPDLARVRFDFNRILWGSDEFAQFEKLSFRDLDKLVHELEHMANCARYALWKRHESGNASN